MNFPLRTTFAAFRRFWIVMISCLSVSRYFLIFSTLSDSLVVQ